MPPIQAETPKPKRRWWIWYLGLVEKLPDQVLLATHTSGHHSIGRDTGQVALLVFVHRLPGVVLAEQLILVSVSLEWQVLWGKKAHINLLQAEPSAVVPPPAPPQSLAVPLNHKVCELRCLQ